MPYGSPSESGAVTPGLIITLAFVLLGAWILTAAFEADTAHHGEVPVPSEGAAVDLPEGEMDVFYAERTSAEPAELTLPAGLQFSIVGEDAGGVESSSRSGDPEETDDGAAQVLAEISVPAEGTYYVTADATDLTGRSRPELTFGQSPLQAVVDRFNEVVEEFKGPTGIIVGVAIVILLLLPAVKRQLDRR